MTRAEAREQRDRERRLSVEQTIRNILRQRPNDGEANLPYNALGGGLIVLDEASDEFAERLEEIQLARRKLPRREISVRADA